MELESLRSIWQELEPQPTPEPSREHILSLLQKRSQGPVARMRRNLRAELLFTIVAYTPAIIFYLVEFQGRLSAVSALLALLALFFGVYYYRKLALLREMECVGCMVRSNLARQVATLKKYIRFYLVASTVMVPFVAVLSYMIFHLRLYYPASPNLYEHLRPSPWWKSSTFWLILLVPLTISIYYFNAWYINRLYGRHIKKLQELLREMDEE